MSFNFMSGSTYTNLLQELTVRRSLVDAYTLSYCLTLLICQGLYTIVDDIAGEGASVDGEPMRGVLTPQLKFTFDDATNTVEVFAV